LSRGKNSAKYLLEREHILRSVRAAVPDSESTETAVDDNLSNDDADRDRNWSITASTSSSTISVSRAGNVRCWKNAFNPEQNWKDFKLGWDMILVAGSRSRVVSCALQKKVQSTRNGADWRTWAQSLGEKPWPLNTASVSQGMAKREGAASHK
jgi:hypothetical protein